MVGSFSDNFATAHARFRKAAHQLGWALESYPIDVPGPGGEPLTFDVALSPAADTAGCLITSSGVHGVEGFLGSAVQLTLLQRWAGTGGSVSPLRCVFMHALNPFGFAWLRRCDADNVDLNRNFLLPGESYSGSPPGYAELDGLLNPKRPPSGREFFALKILAAAATKGVTAVRDAVAVGQYDFPCGLFYGGAAPTFTHQIIARNFPRWLQGSRDVIHLDFHTGLGSWGKYKLITNSPLTASQRKRLESWFGVASISPPEDRQRGSYRAKGNFADWSVAQNIDRNYLFVGAEFGTYGSIRVLSGLRIENQEHHWGHNTAPSSRAKEQLKELFCPDSPAWRERALAMGVDLVDRAIGGIIG
jgi:hypothetical protein